MNERTRTLTPRTDALVERNLSVLDWRQEYIAMKEHARQLETELSAPSQAVTEGVGRLLDACHDLAASVIDGNATMREAEGIIDRITALRSAPPSSQQQSDMEHLTVGLTGPENQGQWIACSERLPELVPSEYIVQYSDYVLVWRPDWREKVFTAQAAYTPQGGYVGWVGIDNATVTHWMPLPPAPGSTMQQQEHPHTDECGFDRNGSHNAGHYVCNCGWEDHGPAHPTDRPVLGHETGGGNET